MSAKVSSKRAPRQLSRRQQQRLREQLLAQIAIGARHCAELEAEFGRNPPPPVETLLKIYRVLILKLSAEAQVQPEQFKLAVSLLRPVLENERIEELRKHRELAEQKHQDQQQARKTAEDRAKEGGGLKPDTLLEIERELALL